MGFSQMEKRVEVCQQTLALIETIETSLPESLSAIKIGFTIMNPFKQERRTSKDKLQ